MSTDSASGHLHVAAESKAPYDDHTLESLRADALAIIAGTLGRARCCRCYTWSSPSRRIS